MDENNSPDKTKYMLCSYCIMDTSDPDIVFDEKGRCNHCKKAESKLNDYPLNLSEEVKSSELKKILNKIKKDGKGKKYDCIIGISGGCDSTYTLVEAVSLGLRPLAVHMDNGWNSELSVQNIEKVVRKLGLDLYTKVLDWNSFRDLQKSFLKASVPDLEIPTDHAIFATLHDIARKNSLKYIIFGSNWATESILPRKWSFGHQDWKYISGLHKTFGKVPLKDFPHFTPQKWGYYKMIMKIKAVPLLDFIDYDKPQAAKMLTEQFGWRNYNVKHGESLYTLFVQSLVLTEKFGYDKRRAHLSSMICSKQITREDALIKMREPLFIDNEREELIELVADKLDVPLDELKSYLQLENKHYDDYPNYMKSFFHREMIGLYLKTKKDGLH
jgi:N-acetyl sugar amidotransferase